MDPYELTLAVVGVAALSAVWLPRLLEGRPLSPLLLMVGLGAAVFALPLGIDLPNPLSNSEPLERLTELGVLVALMGAGLKIDRPFSFRTWTTTWRLLALAMPLFIVAAAVLGHLVLGLPPATAVLLAAALAPTDPVLAGDVQVGEPGGEEEDEVRFSLTSEAGLNDGLAFPFVYAAIAMAEHGADPSGWVGRWLLVDVMARLGIALLIGLVMGRLLGVAVFRLRVGQQGVADTAEGFVALAAIFLVYGVTELAHGYGFLAVFVAASALRASERDHAYQRVLHGFAEQVERLITVGLLVVFGGLLAQGLLRGVGWRTLAFTVAVLLVVRPVTARVALARTDHDPRERMAISFYGVRGVGCFYYLAYALSGTRFADGEVLWTVAACVVVGSLLVHGTSAGPVMAHLDRRRSSRRRRRPRPATRRRRREPLPADGAPSD